MILKHDSYKKDPIKEQNYNPDLEQLDVAGAEEDVPMTRRCCISPLALDREISPCSREVFGPRAPGSLHPPPPVPSASFTTSGFKVVDRIRRRLPTVPDHEVQRDVRQALKQVRRRRRA